MQEIQEEINALLVRGNEVIAPLRLERDLASSKYETAKERLNYNKLQLRLLMEEIGRQWQQTKYE